MTAGKSSWWRLIPCVGLAFVLGAGAEADPITWDGDGADANWSTAENWSGDTLPANDLTTDTAVFETKGSLSDPSIDTARSVTGVTFTGAGWTLGDGGAALTLGMTGIDSAGSGTNTIAADIVMGLASPSTWTVGAGNTLVIDGTVDNGGNALTIDGAGDITLNGVISGAEGLTMSGTGTLTIDSTNTYAGTTTISTGATVNGDGAVAGNFILSTQAVYNPVIDVAGGGAAERILDVGDAVTLAANSGINVTQVAGDTGVIEDGDVFTIINGGAAATDLGAIVFLNGRISAVLEFEPAANGNDIEITATRATNAYEAATVSSANPAMGAALDSVAAVAIADPTQTAAVTLTNDTTALNAAELTQFVQQTNDGTRASGVMVANIATAGARTFTTNQGNYLAARRGGGLGLALAAGDGARAGAQLAAAGDDPAAMRAAIAAARDPWMDPVNDSPWGGYVQPFGVLEDHDTTSTRTGFASTSAGLQLGVDYKLNREWIAGLAFCYARSWVDLDNSLGSIDVNSFRVGPYASMHRDNWFFDSSVTYGYHAHESDRSTLIGSASADYGAQDATLYAGGGRDYEFGFSTLTPTASLQYTYFNRDSYDESGAGALSYDSHTTSMLHSRLGVTWSYLYEPPSGRSIIPAISVGWEHEYIQDNNDVQASFAAAGSSFNVPTDSVDSDSLFLRTGATMLLDQAWAIYIRYDGNYSPNMASHALIAGATFEF